MFCKRVSKYNPIHRNTKGHYTRSDWTSYHDIGHRFDKGVLTKDRYLAVENSYVVAVYSFLNTYSIASLKISELELYDIQRVDLQNTNSDPMREIIKEGYLLQGNEIEYCVRLILREKIWCKLTGAEGIFIHFGYDYYMYFGCDLDMNLLPEPPEGIFFETFSTPYE